MRIGIDIDGVLTDYEKWQLDAGSKFFLKYNKNIVVPDGYDSDTVFNVTKEMDSAFWKEYLYDYAKNEPARKFAGEVIDILKEKGYEIYIITARYLTNKNDELGKQMRDIVKEWLNENRINYDKIIFSPEDKFDICKDNSIDIMIEDKVDNINNISKILPVICFNASYNKSCIGNNIYRVYTWYDVYYTIINKIKDN
ncbi:MAG: hypothetical protein IJ094_05075 [Bacilli bacterium]|nr:hypothetical protein [Bacilli bacterium]